MNKFNSSSLQDIPGPLIELEAINSHSNIPEYMPKIDPKKGTVDPTPYLQTLKVKKGCRVMLVANLDVKVRLVIIMLL